MTSSRGWMLPSGPGKPRRLTAAQKDLVRRTVNAALDELGVETQFRPAVDEARLVVQYALDEYPEDRSCHTCDFLHGSTCLEFKEEVPGEFMDGGCDRHQTDGAPF